MARKLKPRGIYATNINGETIHATLAYTRSEARTNLKLQLGIPRKGRLARGVKMEKIGEEILTAAA